MRNVAFTAEDSNNSPQTEIVLYEPPQSVSGANLAFHGTSVEIRNSQRLNLVSVEPSANGGTVAIDASQRVRYTPRTGFTGTDSFVYVVRDELGRTSRGTATVEVAEGWTNASLPFDTNGDSVVVPTERRSC